MPCSKPKRKLNRSPAGGGVPVVELVVDPVVVEPVVVEPVVVEPVVVDGPVVDELPFELDD